MNKNKIRYKAEWQRIPLSSKEAVYLLDENEKIRGALEWLYESTLKLAGCQPVALENVLVHAKAVLEETKTTDLK